MLVVLGTPIGSSMDLTPEFVVWLGICNYLAVENPKKLAELKSIVEKRLSDKKFAAMCEEFLGNFLNNKATARKHRDVFVNRVFELQRVFDNFSTGEVTPVLEKVFTFNKIFTFNDFTEKKIYKYLAKIASNNILGLISSAGMPIISDPGWLLLQEVVKSGVSVEVVYSKVAFEEALIKLIEFLESRVQGLMLTPLPEAVLVFAGFPPKKAVKGLKNYFKGWFEFIAEMAIEVEKNVYLVFYISRYSLKKVVEALLELEREDGFVFGYEKMGDINEEPSTGKLLLFFVKELTKIHEKILDWELVKRLLYSKLESFQEVESNARNKQITIRQFSWEDFERGEHVLIAVALP